MITLIYRKRDRLIVGSSHKRRTAEQTTQAVITELDNICHSELGGRPGDYATVPVTDAVFNSGMIPTINADFSVTWETVQSSDASDSERASELLSLGSPTWTANDQLELLEIVARRI